MPLQVRLNNLLRQSSICLALVVGALVATPWRSALAQAQRDNLGTEFYVAFAANEGGEQEPTGRTLMALYITSRVPAHGTVEIPALRFVKSFVTTPGKINTIVLPSGNNNGATVEITDDEQIVKGMAVHITSDSEVAVFGMNHKLYSSDAFMALPVDVLGTEYRAMCYNTSELGHGHTNPGEFWFIAVEDSTNVTITLRDMSAAGLPPNSPRTLRMNRGDVYMVQGTADGANDLTGSLIESDHPLAVFSGHMRTQIAHRSVAKNNIASRDHLVEQLPPVSAWGDSALVVPFATSERPDLVRIISAEDNNDVVVNGAPIGRTLNAGDFWEITQLPGVTSIQASKPIMVGQFAHTSWGALGDPVDPAYGDPALALVFPVEQFTTSYTIISIEDQSSFSGNFVNIVAETDALASMKIDGRPIDPTEFKPIPGSRYSYAQHVVEQGTHHLTGDKPFGITIYGLGSVDSYAYTGGSLLKTITPLKTIGLAIDFGDRVLNADLSGTFDSVVTLQNISTDTINIYGFPRRIQDTSKFHVIDPLPTYTLYPGQRGQMTIEFEPRELNRRMHTQITAKTDHLRAYVVDVYGRGVSDDLGLFREALKVKPIDTLDFGIFDPADPQSDSAFFIGNAGLGDLDVRQVVLSGTDAVDFRLGAVALGDQSVSVPFAIPKAPSPAARQVVSFVPSAPNGVRLARVDVTTATGRSHTVILKATVLRVEPLAVPSTIHYDSTLVCEASTSDIVLRNPNPVAVTLLDARMIGGDAPDFSIGRLMPITIASGAEEHLPIVFQPSWDASASTVRRASCALEFDLPKTHTRDTIPVDGAAAKREIKWHSTQSGTVYSSNEFTIPIYAATDLTPYAPLGYRLRLSYDSTHLEFIDLVTHGTLTPTGAGYGTFVSHRGRDTITYNQKDDNSPLTGGGPLEKKPLIYLKFRSHAEGEDPQTYSERFPVHYVIDLLSPRIPATCAERIITDGAVEIVSVCSPTHLGEKSAIPGQMWLGATYPNPFNPEAQFEYDVAPDADDPNSNATVRIDLVSEQGTLVKRLVDGPVPPGYYTVKLSGQDLSPGSYFIRMTAGSYERLRKVALIK